MASMLPVHNIKGLIPLLDRRKVNDPYVVEGKNFLIDADGPFSGLGRSVLAYEAINTLGNIQTFKIAETIESLILNNEGIFRFDTDSYTTILLYKFLSPIETEFPWSMAAVGNKYYFARKGSGLIEYDIVNDSWIVVSGHGIPLNIYACTESDGRLVVLTDLWVAWSAIGDGQDFTPSVVTGAGAQALTKMGLSNPKPIGVKAVADGFLTFLSSGIMKSQAIISTNPYRHTILSRKHIVINPYCLATDEEDSVIFLTKSGLYKTGGGKPEIWQPAMGEYLHTKIIPTLDVINNQNNMQLNFDYDRGWFSIWISETQEAYLYSKTFLLNTKIDAWSSLDDSFVCLANFYTLATSAEGFIFGLVDSAGSIYIFDNAIGIEEIPYFTSGYSYYTHLPDIPIRSNDVILIGTIKASFSTESKSSYTNRGVYYRYSYIQEFVSPADLTEIDKDPSFDGLTYTFSLSGRFAAGAIELQNKLQEASYASLNSYVHVGTFRVLNEADIDRYSELQNISIGTIHSSDSTSDEDWFSEVQYPVTILEDWLTGTGEEDWNFALLSDANYSIDIIATLDGKTPISDYTPKIELVNSESNTDFYSCESSAIYHLIEISALDIDQYYHVKTIDLSVILGGRL